MAELVAELIVRDVVQSAAFYKEWLGAEVTDTAADAQGRWIWAELDGGDGTFMLIAQDAFVAEFPARAAQSPGGACLVSRMKASEVEALYQAAKDKNAVLARDLIKTDYGTTEFALTAPEGTILLFSGKSVS